MALTKEQIEAAVAARAADVAKIEVPEWGGDVYLRKLSAQAVEQLGLADGKRDAATVAKTIAYSLTEEDGTPLYDDVEAGGAIFAQLDMATVARVFAECMRVNELLDEDMEAALARFTEAQHDDSSSD